MYMTAKNTPDGAAGNKADPTPYNPSAISRGQKSIIADRS